jgi:hypothetical protein
MKAIAKISYMIALLAIGLLILWSIGWLTIVTFDLKVFEKQSSEFLLMAILPILATVAGAGIVNIISNIGVIASHITKEQEVASNWNIRRVGYGYLILIVVMVSALFLGNSISHTIKINELKSEFELVVKRNQPMLSAIKQADLAPHNILVARQSMQFIDLQTKKLKAPQILFECSYKGLQALCNIDQSNQSMDLIKKVATENGDSMISATAIDTLDYLWKTSEKEKAIISEMLQDKPSTVEVELDEDGEYQLYQYIETENAKMIFKMGKRELYGRLSS